MFQEEARFLSPRDLIRKRLLRYTRKAYRMLPQLEKPRILDVGCGSGVPTMELARLSNGEIVGLDIDREKLNALRKNVERAGLSDRVKMIHRSLFDLQFSDESFDIIWAEGSIHVIGFEKGLREWGRALKPNSFLVVHDEQGHVQEKLGQIPICGYESLGYFMLNEDVWRLEYFAPLEKLIREARTTCADDRKAMEEIREAQREVDMFKRDPKANSSVFFVMRKR
jgi:ubiquinone/menaquinone biosynthesis C-methylase UbiE